MKLDFKLLAKNGYIKFGCNSSDESTLEIAQAIGQIATLPGLDLVQTLKPGREVSKEKSSYSGNFGMGAFPLHTDMAHWHVPPRFFVLRCIQPTEQVYTSFVPAHEIFDSEDSIMLKRALFRPRRRLDDRLTILRLHENDLFRWDTLFIQPINSYALALQERVAKRIGDTVVQTVTLERSTDCILVDNWKVLHGRSAVPASASNRIVERVYLSTISEYNYAEI